MSDDQPAVDPLDQPPAIHRWCVNPPTETELSDAIDDVSEIWEVARERLTYYVAAGRVNGETGLQAILGWLPVQALRGVPYASRIAVIRRTVDDLMKNPPQCSHVSHPGDDYYPIAITDLGRWWS